MACAWSGGLAPDDNVIVNGLMRARPGAKVTPQRAEHAASASPAPADGAN